MLDKLINKNLDYLKETIKCDDDAIEIYRYSLRIIYSYLFAYSLQKNYCRLIGTKSIYLTLT